MYRVPCCTWFKAGLQVILPSSGLKSGGTLPSKTRDLLFKSGSVFFIVVRIPSHKLD